MLGFFPHWLESYSIAEILYFKIEEIKTNQIAF